MSRMARRTRARRLIAAVDGRSRAASRLRLPFDKKNQRRKKKKNQGLDTGRLWPLPRILWELAW